MGRHSETSEDESMSSFEAIRQIIGPFRQPLMIFCGATFLVALLEAVFLVVVTRAALAIVDDRRSVQITRGIELSIGSTVGIGLTILVIRFIASYLMIRIQTGLTYRITAGYRSRLGIGFLRSNYQTQSAQAAGSLQQLVVDFPSRISSLVFQLSNAISGGLGLLALLGIAAVVNPLSTLVVVAVLVLLYSILIPLRRVVARRSRRTLGRRVVFANRVAEISNLNLEINALGSTDSALQRLQVAITEEAQASNRLGMASGIIAPTYLGLAYGAILLAIWSLSHVDTSSINEVGAVMLIMLRSLSYGQQLQQGSTSIGEFAPYAEEVSAKISTFEANPQSSGSKVISEIDEVSFSRVSFGYQNRESILENVDFSVHRGQIIGLIGPSGSGKTSIVNLLLGLLEPLKGEVKVNGINLLHVDRHSWHRLVTYVPQETRLLTGTIRENVRFLRASVTDAEIDQALINAGLTFDPTMFPHATETDIGEAGRQMSGGQRQRLAIARALVTKPSLLVLDEPTSSLDRESEEVVMETLERLRGQVTVLVITHRDSTLKVCDRVLSLENQKVVEIPRAFRGESVEAQ